jgi:hypothetical protein
VIVRLLLWNLADSKTTLDERARLSQSPNRNWISNEATERFGVVETWDDAPGDFPDEIRDLNGQGPRGRRGVRRRGLTGTWPHRTPGALFPQPVPGTSPVTRA